jgi:hypothetical protein
LHDRGWEPSVGGAAPGSKLVEPPAENISEAPNAAICDLRQPHRTPEGRIAELEWLEHHRPGRVPDVLRTSFDRRRRLLEVSASNKPFGRWGEVFGDATVAAAMIDRLVHHASVVSLKGDSHRLKGRDLGRVPTDEQG